MEKVGKCCGVFWNNWLYLTLYRLGYGNFFLGILNGVLTLVHLIQLIDRDYRFNVGSEEYKEYSFAFHQFLSLPTWFIILAFVLGWLQALICLLIYYGIKRMENPPSGKLYEILFLVLGLIGLTVSVLPWILAKSDKPSHPEHDSSPDYNHPKNKYTL